MQYSQKDTKCIYDSNTLTLLSSSTNDLCSSTQKGNVSVGSLNKTLSPVVLAVWRILKLIYGTVEIVQLLKYYCLGVLIWFVISAVQKN